MYKQLSLLLLFNLFYECSGTETLKGDPTAPAGQTFSFPVKTHVLGNRFYVGANNQQGATFSISRVNKAGDAFEGLTPERVTLNGKPDQLNPLFNAQINFLKLFNTTNNQPVAVTQTEKDIFLVQEQSGNKGVVLSATNVKDAGGDTTGGIVGLEVAGKKQNEREGTDRILLAVKGNGESGFGAGNSGIALLGLNNIIDEEIVGTNVLLRQFSITQLNSETDAVKIGSDLTTMGNIVDLHWSGPLEILYIGLQTQAGGLATDGTRAVVAAHFVGNNLVYTPIAPDAVFSGATDKIVGAVGANELVSIHKVRTLLTSKAQLTYLIVLGGNGSPSTTQNVVFALPVVNTRIPGQSDSVKFAIQGTLADVTQVPTDLFNANNSNRFQVREFKDPATDATQVFTETDVAAQVGGGVLPAGNVEDLFVIGDTVFVTVGTSAVGQLPGIFYSEAVLDINSVIIGWTNWQQVGGTTDQVFGAQIFHPGDKQAWDGSFIFMTGSDVDTVSTVKKTLWSSGSDTGTRPLTDLLSQSFAQVDGGIRRLYTFPERIAALSGISLLVATGLDKVALIESGRTIGGIFTPNRGQDFLKDREVFNNGAIEETFLPGSQTRYIQLSGGLLNSLGPITASEIASDGPDLNGWLFVGGMKGVAVLADSNGSGWDIGGGALTNGFNGLTDQMLFQQVGNYTNVRKLISDRGFLYVLTDTTLDRINLQTSNFATKTLDVTPLATLQTFKELGASGILLDVVVSEKIVILSTSIGLFRIGDGKDIATVTSAQDIDWDALTLPNSVLPVLQLFVISTTGVPQDVSRNGGGMIYALDAYAGFNQGRIHRIAIEDTTSSAVDDMAIVPFNDLAFKNLNSFFITFPVFRGLTNIDGALLLSTKDKDLEVPLQLFAGAGIMTRGIPLAIGEFSSDLVSIVRSSASGSWLVAGDFGLRVNE